MLCAAPDLLDARMEDRHPMPRRRRPVGALEAGEEGPAEGVEVLGARAHRQEDGPGGG